MDLQLNGRCTKVFDTEYTSKKDGSKQKKHHFVLEVVDGQYSKKVHFTVMDDERFMRMGIVEGGTYNVSFDVSSREYNGNWYTDIVAWRALRVDNAPKQAQIHAQAPVTHTSAPVKEQPTQEFVAPQPQQGGNDLPF